MAALMHLQTFRVNTGTTLSPSSDMVETSSYTFIPAEMQAAVFKCHYVGRQRTSAVYFPTINTRQQQAKLSSGTRSPSNS